MTIAILGGGFLGVCTALECARRGMSVDLYERAAEVITEAGLVNEGKIHLGYVYAHDPSLRTATKLMRGALTFTRDLGRWLDLQASPLEVSEPFHYVVPRASSMTAGDIEAYFHRIEGIYDELGQSLGVRYLERPAGPFVAPLSHAERERHYDGSTILAAYSTIERSVDPARLAERLRAGVRTAPEIRLRTGCTVTGVERKGAGAWEVAFDGAGARHREGYDSVVNCLWSGRLTIDAGLGLLPQRPWLYRYKFGARLVLPPATARPPTVTMIHGAFGDVVEFPSRQLYISWYPSGMVGKSGAIVPPDWAARYGPAERRRICDESARSLGTMCHALRDLPAAVIDTATVTGGVIFAWGATDIHDAGSELHQRFDIGIRSEDTYHSVDPGKFTMAPAYALEVCERLGGGR